MKKWIGVTLTLVLVVFCALALADVKIDVAHFPDDIFRELVKREYDADGDNTLSNAEISEVFSIDCSQLGIKSLQGIEYFTEITDLSCFENKLTALDLRGNTKLTQLYCFTNRLKSLNVSKCKELSWLGCGQNQLESLDVSRNTKLMGFECFQNKLTKLDISQNTEIGYFRCDNNRLTTLNTEKNTKLQYLDCSSNRLTRLNLSRNKKLNCLRANNNQLKKLDISAISFLKKLVKNQDPLIIDGKYLVWEGEPNVYNLVVDLSVELITEPEAATDIGKAVIAAIPDQLYTGKAIRPFVTVTYGGKELTKGTDYTVSYQNNKTVGKAKVTVTGKGNYKGTKSAAFKIVPKGVELSSLTAGTGQLTVKWKKGSNISGYQIEYSTKKDFSSSRRVSAIKATMTEKVIKELKANKTYYVRIRTYKIVNGVKYFSAWSEAKSRKTR